MNSISFLKKCENHIKKSGIAETTFGKKVANDSYFLKRLRSGGSVTLRVMERTLHFISDYEEKSKKQEVKNDA